MEKGALRAGEIGANAFQIFSSSPRMWRYSNLDPTQVKLMRKARERFDLYPLIIHASYLINLGSSDPDLHVKSIEAFRSEVARAIEIGAEYVVVHPGNYKGCSAVEEGICTVAKGLILATEGLKTKRVEVLLENTVGAGCSIGGRFRELYAIRELCQGRMSIPVNYCIDTCHCFCSGYDVSTEAGLKSTIKEIEKEIGVENVKVIHTNDSKTGLNSHVDRHEHIGKGRIGIEGFRNMLNHPKLKTKPFILETPVDEPGDDRRNLETLHSLVRRPGKKLAR